MDRASMPHHAGYAVTGGLSYIGKYITRRLVDGGGEVVILTGHPTRPNPFGDRVRIAPLSFQSPTALCESLRGTTTLFNTYWLRFDSNEVSFARAVEQSRMLIHAAQKADVQRIVHLSVSNPSATSSFPYFRGKAQVEGIIAASGIPHAILRPTLVFGGQEEILVNNIAWLLRRFPVFAIPRGPAYRLQPVHVDDVAALAVQAAAEGGARVFDAAGPDVYRFEDLVRVIATGIGSHAVLVRTSPSVTLALIRILNLLLRDVVLTPDELGALGADLLVSADAPRGGIRFEEWLTEHRAQLGRRYASEMARHFR